SFVMSLFFFLNDLTPTYIYTLSLHDALPILVRDEPLVGLTGAPVLAEFRKHQLDCRLNPQIRIFDDAILASTPVSRRYDAEQFPDRKSTRLNSSHVAISYAVFCLKKKKNKRS